MSDWSDIEIPAALAKNRKKPDFLPFVADLLVVWDFFLCVAVGEVALQTYAHLISSATLDLPSAGQFWRDIVFGSIIAALILRSPQERLNPKSHSPLEMVLASEIRCGLAFAVLIFVGIATRATSDLARLWLISWFLLFAVTVAVTRWLLGTYIRRLGKHGKLREAIAIVGSAAARELMAARIGNDAHIVGLFGTDEPSPDAKREDQFAKLLELGRDGAVDSVIVAMSAEHDQEVSHLVHQLKALPVQVAVYPDSCALDKAAFQTRLLGGIAMAVVADTPLKLWDLLIKAAFDKLGALILLMLFGLPMIVIALSVIATSPGPVIFCQKRRGWSGRDFNIYKFRSMKAEGASSGGQTSRFDTRCTTVGRWLRSCSADELPQLWNVLLGDMSLVGPRPHAEILHDIDRAGRDIVAEYAQRHRMKPGLTGWAQINGARGPTISLAQMRRRVLLDLYYIEHWSLWLDVKILARTPLCLIGNNVF